MSQGGKVLFFLHALIPDVADQWYSRAFLAFTQNLRRIAAPPLWCLKMIEVYKFQNVLQAGYKREIVVHGPLQLMVFSTLPGNCSVEHFPHLDQHSAFRSGHQHSLSASASGLVSQKPRLARYQEPPISQGYFCLYTSAGLGLPGHHRLSVSVASTLFSKTDRHKVLYPFAFPTL